MLVSVLYFVVKSKTNTWFVEKGKISIFDSPLFSTLFFQLDTCFCLNYGTLNIVTSPKIKCEITEKRRTEIGWASVAITETNNMNAYDGQIKAKKLR